jgi:hypothetical protein
MDDSIREKFMNTDLTVQQVSDLPTIISNLVAYGEDKQEIMLDEQDKEELAVLFMSKGHTSGAVKKVKELEDMVKEVGSPWLLARGIKTVTVAGIGTLSQANGGSVSISQDTLRKVLINYLSAEKVMEVMEKVVKRTSYTTLQFKAQSPKE